MNLGQTFSLEEKSWWVLIAFLPKIIIKNKEFSCMGHKKWSMLN